MTLVWNGSTQYFIDAFSKPRTEDTQFDSVLQELNIIEKGMLELKTIFSNFKTYIIDITNFYNKISLAINKIYGNNNRNDNSTYNTIFNNIADAQKKMEVFTNDFIATTLHLLPKTSEWNKLFDQARNQLKQHSKIRKEYEHYDDKLDEIYKKKMHVSTKKTELDYVLRNRDKYQTATENYVKSSKETYYTITDVLKRRYDIVNPVFMEFLTEQKKYYQDLAKESEEFDKVHESFSITINQKQRRSLNNNNPIGYDPCKYIRGGLLISATVIKKNGDHTPKDDSELLFNDDDNHNDTTRKVKIFKIKKKVLYEFLYLPDSIQEIEPLRNSLLYNPNNTIQTFQFRHEKGNIKNMFYLPHSSSLLYHSSKKNNGQFIDYFFDFF